MILVFLSILLAMGAPREDRSAGALTEHWRSLRELELDPELFRLVEEPIVLDEGPVTLTLREGFLIPVFSGRYQDDWSRSRREILAKLREDRDAPQELPDEAQRGSRDLVGFVWVGDGTMSSTFPERGDALRLANDAVMKNRMTLEEGQSIRNGGAVALPIDRGLILSSDPRLRDAFLGPEENRQTDDPLEIVVYGNPPGRLAALETAKMLFGSRLSELRADHIDPGEQVAWDRVAASRLQPNPDPWLVAELHVGAGGSVLAPSSVVDTSACVSVMATSFP